jgi:hypothetical protein
MASSASTQVPPPIAQTIHLEPGQTGELAGVVFRLSLAAVRTAVILESTDPLTFDIDAGNLKFPADPEAEPL